MEFRLGESTICVDTLVKQFSCGSQAGGGQGRRIWVPVEPGRDQSTLVRCQVSPMPLLQPTSMLEAAAVCSISRIVHGLFIDLDITFE